MQITNSFIIIVLILGVCFIILKGNSTFSTFSFPKPGSSPSSDRTVPPSESDRNSHATQPMSSYRLIQYGANGGEEKSYVISKLHPYMQEDIDITIGLGADCDIRVEDRNRYIGQHHAVIRRYEDGTYLEDNSSKNGVFDSEQRPVDEILLKPGTRFYLANTLFEFSKINVFETPIYSRNGDHNHKVKTKNYQKGERASW